MNNETDAKDARDDRFEWAADRLNLRLYWWDHPEHLDELPSEGVTKKPAESVADILDMLPIVDLDVVGLASYMFDKYTTFSEHVTYRRFLAEVRKFEAAGGKLSDPLRRFFEELERLLLAEAEAEMVVHRANMASWVACDTDSATDFVSW